MKKMTIGLGVLLIIATAMLLPGCKPIPYYLERVYKAYGKVTGESDGTGIGSVAVSIGDFLYSDLTNGWGDYDLELPEGTWRITYKPRSNPNQPAVHDEGEAIVTVGPSTPNVRVDVALPLRKYAGNWARTIPEQGLTENLTVACWWDSGTGNQGTNLSMSVVEGSGAAWSLAGYVFATSESRLDFWPEWTGDEWWDAVLAQFGAAGLGNGVNEINLPYSIVETETGRQITLTIPTQAGLEYHTLDWTGQ